VSKLHIIYIPGIGDHKLAGQQKAINTWHFYRVEAEICQMNWIDGQPWPPKFERILNRIDTLVAEGNQVGLVGVSAGASAAINAYAARKDKLAGLVCIAGKILRPQTIGGKYKRQNPAFVTSAYDCQKSLATLNEADRQRIQTRFGIFDNIVLTRDSRIEGAHNKRVPMILHTPIIATQIYLAAWSITRFLKHQAK
jgi:hypothetical protein